MKPLAALSFMLCLATAASHAATPPIYRCGNAYSESPCPAAKLLEVADARSAAQRTEADRVIASDRRLAAEMRRDRLADEAALKPTGASSLSGVAAKPVVPAPVARTKPAKKRKSSTVARAAKVVASTPSAAPRSAARPKRGKA